MQKLVQLLPDLLAASGLAVLSVGLWWIYPPAALLAVGLALLVVGVLLGRRK